MAYVYGFLAILLLVITLGNAQLSPNFYDSTCPQALSIIRAAVTAAVNPEARMGASLLRLHFHDCFVNGCDGSVLLDDTSTFTGEKTAAPNDRSLRGFEVIDTIKAQLEMACPGVVSCADILAVAARDGTVAVNGPSWTVPLGRRDSITASFATANNDLPAQFSDLPDLVSSFSNKGFTVSEMVALSGSHTIGQARCTTFRMRIYNDIDIDSQYATSLQANCPNTNGVNDDNLEPLDVVSPNNFNNDYYQNLLQQRGLLHSDQQLLNSTATTQQVTAYASVSSSFFNDFADAMVKMSNLGPITGTQGQIRTNCRTVN